MNFNFEKLLSNACVKNGNAARIFPPNPWLLPLLNILLFPLHEERVPKLESKCQEGFF